MRPAPSGRVEPGATPVARPGTAAGAQPTSRRRFWIAPALVLVVWLIGGGPLGQFAGRLAEVQTNDNAGFLPASAESTLVQELQAGFAAEETLPAVVVWEFDRPVTPADVADVQRGVGLLAGLDGLVGDVLGPLPAEDGLAFQAIALIGAADVELAGEIVTEMRQLLAEESATSDTRVFVTGPAGFLADFSAAFGAIDGILLGVTISVVLAILLIVYRSPILPFVVLTSGLLALGTASALVYVLADNGVITLNGQSQGILFILVLGASTDYALLLVSRFREELREQDSPWHSMRHAYRGALPPILASGATVILGVLCLLFSDLNSNKGLGPVAALGIAFAMLAALSFLPAALVLLGRAAFWPFRPAVGSAHPEVQGLWGKVAGLVGRRYRVVWVATGAALLGLAAFLPLFRADGVATAELFLTPVEAVEGQEALASHFVAGSGSPVVVIGAQEHLADMLATLRGDPGVQSAVPTLASPAQTQGDPGAAGGPGVAGDGGAAADRGAAGGPGSVGDPAAAVDPRAGVLTVDGNVEVQATLRDAADGPAATRTVERLRIALDAVSEDILVGGPTAQQLDVNTTARRDLRVIIPIVLAVVLAVLALLLRSLVAPVLLVATVVLSFAATLGTAALLFTYAFQWPGADPSVPLFAFVFLVALGIDYNIFLMTRAREESLRLGTRAGILRSLAVTGGVITSAGVVLAATFSALAVLPLLFLAQIAFLVAFGVLLDTVVVRSLLVPALSYDLGPRIWAPSAMARDRREPGAAARADPEPSAVSRAE